MPNARKGIVRLTTADSLQEFYRQPQPAIREEGLIFETHDHLISLSPTGELMTYRLVPEEGARSPQTRREDPEEHEVVLIDDRRLRRRFCGLWEAVPERLTGDWTGSRASPTPAGSAPTRGRR